jgi:SAM-dependent methyltransferase
VGIDSSAQAVKMAGANCIRETLANIELKCCSFTDLAADKFDVVYISNLYQLLKPNERQELQRTIQKVLQPNGLVFLSTLSVNDPEHYGKGTPAVDDKDSFVDEKYLHFCTRLELKHDFNFLDIIELYECWYEEPHASGQSHHHVSWILVGVGKPSVIAESSH